MGIFQAITWIYVYQTERKTLLFHSKSINIIFWIIFNLAIPSKPNKDISSKSRQARVRLARSDHTLPTIWPSALPFYKKSRTLINSLERYCWSENPRVWFDELVKIPRIILMKKIMSKHIWAQLGMPSHTQPNQI